MPLAILAMRRIVDVGVTTGKAAEMIGVLPTTIATTATAEGATTGVTVAMAKEGRVDPRRSPSSAQPPLRGGAIRATSGLLGR